MQTLGETGVLVRPYREDHTLTAEEEKALVKRINDAGYAVGRILLPGAPWNLHGVGGQYPTLEEAAEAADQYAREALA